MSEGKENLGGRPTTLTQEVADKIISQVRATLSLNHASEAHEIPRSTLATWISRGSSDYELGLDNIFVQFSKGIKRARSQWVNDAVVSVRNGTQNWQATAWLLERCVAEDFGRDSELYKQLLEDYKMLMQTMIDRGK